MSDTKTKTVSFVDEETEQVLRRNCEHPNPNLTSKTSSQKNQHPVQKALAKFLAGDVSGRRPSCAISAGEKETRFVYTEKIPSHLRPEKSPLPGKLRFFCDNFVSSIAGANRKPS